MPLILPALRPDAESSPAPAGPAPARPDPSLTASIYCSGRLDEVLCRAVAPFWRWFQGRHPGAAEESYLWVMRYAKCGDHLKVRIHAPEPCRADLRAGLTLAVESYLVALPPPEPGWRQRFRDEAVPVDAEDRASSNRPDRSLLWTTYERSHVSFGFEPFLSDDVHVALLSRCLGRGTEVVLGRLATGADGTCPHGRLQAILLNALTAGLGALPFGARERGSYLLYHRDWLLRSALKQGGTAGGPRKMAETLAAFGRQIDRLGGRAGEIGQVAGRCWDRGGWPECDADLRAWGRAVAELGAHAAERCQDPAFRIDPFAEVPCFAPLFKAFHGLANQLGLTPMNEAFVHHLLLQATADEDLRGRGVVLFPWSLG